MDQAEEFHKPHELPVFVLRDFVSCQQHRLGFLWKHSHLFKLSCAVLLCRDSNRGKSGYFVDTHWTEKLFIKPDSDVSKSKYLFWMSPGKGWQTKGFLSLLKH